MSLSTLSSRWQKGFDAAQAAAEYSDGKSEARRMGAALFAGSRLIGVGFNQLWKSHPEGMQRRNFRMHAEHAVLLKRRHYDPVPGTVIYVWRSVGGKPACSRPCSNCLALLKVAGIERVRFINNKGQFTEESIS